MLLRFSFLLFTLSLNLLAQDKEINILKLKAIDKMEEFKTGEGHDAVYNNRGLFIGMIVSVKQDKDEIKPFGVQSPLVPKNLDLVTHSYFDKGNLTIYEVGFRKLEGKKSEQILTIYDASSKTKKPEKMSAVIPTDNPVFSKLVRKGDEITLTTLVGLQKEDKTFVFEIKRGNNEAPKLELKK